MFNLPVSITTKEFPLIEIIILVILAGCNGGTTTSTERVPYQGSSPGDAPSVGTGPSTTNHSPGPRSDMGGSYTGGENGAMGRPNESLLKNITLLDEYIQFVEPRMAWLRSVLPNFANILEHITSPERHWYFTPTPLEPIDTALVGVPLYYGDSDQLALQDKSEIWIAQFQYEKMPAAEKAILLFHEMVMGARLMEFQRAYDKCLALAGKDLNKLTDQDQIRANRRDCGLQYPKPFDFGQDIVNSNELTQSVRTLVGKLMDDKFQDLDPNELAHWLTLNGFIF